MDNNHIELSNLEKNKFLKILANIMFPRGSIGESLNGGILYAIVQIEAIKTDDDLGENKLPKFATGGIVNQGSFLTHPSRDIEMVGPSNLTSPREHTQEIIETIRKSVEKGISNCAFKVGD